MLRDTLPYPIRQNLYPTRTSNVRFERVRVMPVVPTAAQTRTPTTEFYLFAATSFLNMLHILQLNSVPVFLLQSRSLDRD
mmetsp:Transcript_15690/g.32474  ORF Transcript_15690/g.32474 Transcript_15690/m.32474 type:complete len:80 (-) Transcript_15690:358-597(-)